MTNIADDISRAYQDGYNDGYNDGYQAGEYGAIRHGRWEEWWPGDCALILTEEEMLWMCSDCSAKVSNKSNFCPNCGARMDGES